MKSKRTNKKSLAKKILRIFLWLTSIVFLLFIVAFIVIRIKFPPDKVKKMIEIQASQAVNNRRIEIGNAYLNPFKGFRFDDIDIYDLPANDLLAPDSVKFISIKKASVKYKLSSLFKRTLKIREIVIDHPQINIILDAQNQTNFDDLLESTATTPEDTVKIPYDTSVAEFSIPVSFELDKFDFKNFNAFITSESEDMTVRAHLRNFSVFLSELSIPRGDWDNIKDKVKAELQIISLNSPWNFYIDDVNLKTPLEMDTKFDLNIDLLMQGIHDLQFNGKISFGETILRELGDIPNITRLPVSQLVNLMFMFQVDGEHGEINIEQLSAQLVEQQAFSLTGNITDLFTEPNVSLMVENSQIKLSNLFHALKPLVPSDFREYAEGMAVEGILSFKNTKFLGNPTSTNMDEGLIFETVVGLEKFNARYSSPKTNIDSLSLSLTVKGLYNDFGLFNSMIDGKLDISKLSANVNDTIQINLKNLSTELSAKISNEYFPTHLNLKGEIEDIFNGFAALDLNFRSENKLQNYSLDAALDVNNLEIANLPLSPGTGLMNSHVVINSSSLDKIITKLNFSTDSLFLALDESNELALAPIQINGLIDVATDSNFQDVNIREINFNANDFLTLNGRTELKALGEQGFQVDIDSVMINHPKLFDFIPLSFKQGLENFEINGETIIKAKINGKIPPEGAPEINAKALANMNANISYPDIPLSIGSIVGFIDLNSDGNSADATAQINIDSLILTGVRDRPLNNSSMTLSCTLPNYDQARIDSSVLLLPELDSKLTLIGKIDSLSTYPKADLDLLFNFFAIDSVLLMNDLYALGNLDTKVNIQFKQPILSIDGDLNLYQLSTFLSDQIEIQDISGKIPFTQKINIDSVTLIEDENFKPLIADVGALNYNLLQPYYWNDYKEVSYIEIKNINVTGYEISDFLMNIRLGNGKVEIPDISMSLYDGNMRGNIFADVGDGDPENVRYFLKANISRLNSAKLSPLGGSSAKASELNMNMEFSGTGIDPTKDIDFGGYLYITKIGSKFADNVLNSLDPVGKDKSIQDTKRLLNWGYKPKLISFEIKHGYMYPTIHLVKGNFLTKLIPLNLSGGKIELARIPVKFFLETQMAQVQ